MSSLFEQNGQDGHHIGSPLTSHQTLGQVQSSEGGPHCHECGSEDLGGYCRQCGARVEELVTLLAEERANRENAEVELRKYRAKVKRLQGDNRVRQQQNPHYEAAMRVLEHWRQLCHPGAIELKGERLTRVLQRLEAGYLEQQLKDCVIGYSRFPFVINHRRVTHGSPAQRRIDAELIFRDPQHVDQGIAFALEAARMDQVIPKMPQTPQSLPSEGTPELGDHGKSALRLTEFGFHVFPVRPRGKVPCTPNGLKDATQDLVRITQFWLKHPEHNIGVRCGVESMLVVLDVDGDIGSASLRALESRFEKLPVTASIVTPRGGSHFYFRHPGTGELHNTAGFPGPGLDIRGDGGYVLAPPSVGANGRRYEVDEQAPLAPVPIWLLNLLVERQTELPLFGRDYAEFVRKGVREGERNSALFAYAGHLWSHGHKPNEILEMVSAMNDSRCSPPLPPRELTAIVKSLSTREHRRSQATLKALIRGQSFGS